jgi:hypothetical protein
VTTYRVAAGTQFPVDLRRAVEAPVLLEHRLDLSGQACILGRSLSRRLLPLPPGVGASRAAVPLALRVCGKNSLTSRVVPFLELIWLCSGWISAVQ